MRSGGAKRIRTAVTSGGRSAGRAVIVCAVAAVTACSAGPSTAAPQSGPSGTAGTAVPETAVPVTAAASPACDTANLYDVDGDSQRDSIVGMPGFTATKRDQTGAVDVRGTASGKHLLRAADLGAADGAAGGFGSAIGMADLNGDWCVDLVIGAPNEQADAAAGGRAGPGQVYIVFGGPDGLDPDTAIRLPRPATNEADGFGGGLALVDRRAEINDTRDHDLYVGAPATTVHGKAQAGQVWRYRITAGTDGRVTTTRLEARHPGSDGVPGAAQAGTRFGEVLAPLSRDNGGVLVGVPGTDVGAARDAGALWSMPVDSSGTVLAATMWTQDSDGVPGRAETGDRFGAAIGSGSYWAVVGAPGESFGPARKAGLAQVFSMSKEGDVRLTPGVAISQNSRGIPDVAETGDRFGAAIAVGAGLVSPGSGTVDAAIGAPGEDVGPATNAGTVVILPVNEQDLSYVRPVRQGQRLSGTPEAGDAVGSVLGVALSSLYLDEDYYDSLLVGVPHEDIGTRTDAGMVQRVRYRPSDRLPNVTFSGGYRNARDYGQVFPVAVT